MKISEAKEIVGSIFEWQLVLMSVKERSEIKSTIDLTKYSLEDLIKANKIIGLNNNRKRKAQQKKVESGGKSRGIALQTTLDDRLIAGCYVALNYRPNGEMAVLLNDVAVACVVPNYA